MLQSYVAKFEGKEQPNKQEMGRNRCGGKVKIEISLEIEPESDQSPRDRVS